MSDDPDAMWRPGYTGPVLYARRVSRPPSAPPSRWRGGPLVVAGAVALGAIAVGSVVLVVADGDPAPPSTTVSRVPTGSSEQWSVTLDVVDVPTVGGSDDTIVIATEGESPAVVALDAATGVERWSAEPPDGRIDAVDLIGDVAVLTAMSPAGDRALHALDLSTGEERWDLPAATDARSSVDAGQVLVVQGSDGSSPARSVRWVDPATGEIESELDGGDITLSRSGVQRRAGDEIEVFDRRPFRRRAVVDLDALGLANQSGVLAVATDAGVVLATRTAVMLVQGDEVRSTVGLTPLPIGWGRTGLQALDAAGRYVAVEHGDALLVLSTDDGELHQLWKESAWLLDWRVDTRRQLVAIATVNGSVVSMPPEVVDAATGRTLWDGPAAVQQSSPLRTFADNGFIAVVTPRSGARSPAVVGYDLDRAEMWRRPIGPGTDFALVDGGLVTIHPEPGAGGTTLTYFS